MGAERAQPGSGRQRVFAVLVLVLAGLTGFFSWRAFDTSGSVGIHPHAADPWAHVPTGWTKLPPPPEVRDGAAFVWTGSEVLAWGGCDPSVKDDCTPTDDGFAFDPSTGTWRSLPEAPLPGAHADSVWTGREAVFFLENGGLAYDPANLTWRTIAPPPIDVGRSAVHVWTGTQVFVWGGGRRGEPTSAEGALYDPSADSWQRIADAPIGLTLASGMWTGREVIVFGSLLDGRNVAETPTSVGAAYDPITDTWHELPASSLSPQAASAFWVGDRMVAWDYEVHSQQFDPVRDTWAAPAQMPFHFDECYPESAVVGGLGFAFFCGQSALYDAATSAWREIHGGPLDEEIGANDASYKLWRFASLAPADDVLFLQMEGITVVGKDDTPCYGCPGSPVSFWAYRP